MGMNNEDAHRSPGSIEFRSRTLAHGHEASTDTIAARRQEDYAELAVDRRAGCSLRRYLTLGEKAELLQRGRRQHVSHAAFRCFRLGGGQMLPRQLRVCHRSRCTAFVEAADANLVPLNISRPCADGALE